MQKAVLSERNLGIVKSYDREGFASVRHKAKEEIQERKRKYKKDKITPVPRHSMGELVVVLEKYGHTRKYLLVEMIDFHQIWKTDFEYYGIIKSVDHRNDEDRIGRLCTFGENYGRGSYEVANIGVNDIQWKA